MLYISIPTLPPGAIHLEPVNHPAPSQHPVFFSETAALLACYVTMALGVALNHGHFAWRAILLESVSAGCLVFGARQQLAGRVRSTIALEKLLAAALVFLLVAGVFDAPGYYLKNTDYRPAYIAIQLGLALAVAASFFRTTARDQFRRGVFFAGAALGFGLRVWMVTASPQPIIDVFNQFQESSAHLLHGLNPYSTPVTDPLEGAKNFGYHVTGYSYPPSNLYAHVLSYAALGDIRYGYIAAELVAMVCLYSLVAASHKTAAQLLVLLFLFHPRGLFTIEQAWTEPFLVGSAAGFLWLAVKRPTSRWVPVVFGLFLSLKQYLVFFAALFFAAAKRWRLILPVSAVILLTWLPFLIWDSYSAVQNGLLFQFRTSFRDDGLTLASVAFRWFGWESSKWMAIAVGAATAAFTWQKFQARTIGGYLYSSLITTLAVFLSGSQAFCNYYYFLGALVLFLIAIRLREESSHAG
jgi:hypothetical protein